MKAKYRVAAFCVWLLLFSWPLSALAHASLISSVPADQAFLSVAPAQAVLTFNEPVVPLLITLIQPNGTTIKPDAVHSQLNRLQIDLPSLIQQGTYALSWRVISADGHPVGATLLFSVGSQSLSIPETASKTSLLRSFLIWLFRTGVYISVFFGVGLAVWSSADAVSSKPRRLGLEIVLPGIVMLFISIGLLGLDALNEPLTAFFTLAPWHTALHTSFGLSAGLTLLALIMAMLVWWFTSKAANYLLAALAVILLGGSFALSGHASAAPPAILARPAVLFHSLAVVAWVGSLLPLAYNLPTSASRSTLLTFSRYIPAILVVLISSGIILIYLQFDSLSSLWLTAYGQVLSLKLVLVAALLALGAYNRYALTASVLQSVTCAQHRMRRVILLECLLALIIFAVVALWRFTPPPRALVSAPTSIPATAHAHTDDAMADISFIVDSNNTITEMNLILSKPDSSPLAAQEVELMFINPSADIEPISLSANIRPNGVWQLKNLTLPYQKHWRIRIRALISDFDRISLETSF